MLEVIDYTDGIAFVQDSIEIAFYCHFSDKIRYNLHNIEKIYNLSFVNCAELPFNVNMAILKEIENRKEWNPKSIRKDNICENIIEKEEKNEQRN